MKKIISFFLFLVFAINLSGQEMKIRTVQPGEVCYTWPFDFSFSLGMVSINDHPTYYNGREIPSKDASFDFKLFGITAGFSCPHIKTGEKIYQYSKIAQCDYQRWGLELGKLYYCTRNGKVHGLSVAPTYTMIKYSLYDTSENYIGWKDYDKAKYNEYHRDNPNISTIGIVVSYSYQAFCIDVAVSKNTFEVSIGVNLLDAKSGVSLFE